MVHPGGTDESQTVNVAASAKRVPPTALHSSAKDNDDLAEPVISKSALSSVTFAQNNTSLRPRSRSRSRSHSPLSIPFLPGNSDLPPSALSKKRVTHRNFETVDSHSTNKRAKFTRNFAKRFRGMRSSGDQHHDNNRNKNSSDQNYYSDGDIDISPARKRSMKVESKHIEMGSMRDKFQKNTGKSKIKRDGPTMIKRVGDWGLGRWIGYCFWVILALTIQMSIGIKGSWAFPDGRGPVCISNVDMVDSGNDDDAGAAGGSNIKNKSMCLLAETLDNGAYSLGLLSAFILGGFLVGSVQLWLTRRRGYIALCGATRNLLINVCSIIPDPMDKKLFARWVVLGYELAVLKGRGLIDAEEGKAYLDKLHLIEEDEWHAMVNGDRHTTVWFWIQVKAEKLMRKNEIQGLEFQTICRAVTLSRGTAHDLMSRAFLDQPPPYTFVCGLLININLLLLSLTTGMKWAIWMYDTAGGIWKEPRMYAEVMILFFNTCIYAMLFDLCTLLYNPFGPRKIDLVHYEMGGEIRRLAKSLSTNDSYPSTLEQELGARSTTKVNRVAFIDQIDDERSTMEAEAQLMNDVYRMMVKQQPRRISIPMGFSILSGKGRRSFMRRSDFSDI